MTVVIVCEGPENACYLLGRWPIYFPGDSNRMALSQVIGEPFLDIDAGESLATAVKKLRDHECAALVYQIEETWRILPAELLPWLLMTRPEALDKPVSALAQPLTTVSDLDSPATLQGALHANAWVGVVCEGKLLRLLQWATLGPLSCLGLGQSWAA